MPIWGFRGLGFWGLGGFGVLINSRSTALGGPYVIAWNVRFQAKPANLTSELVVLGGGGGLWGFGRIK